MLDLTGIVFSALMMLFVVFRAVQLDRSIPWFDKSAPEPTATPEAQKETPSRPPWRVRR
jgi:hypothetical protein